MNGSEKQITWANEIKAGKNFGAWAGKGKDAAANATIDKAIAFIGSIDNAAFWIDNRDRSEQAIMTDLFAGRLQIKGSSSGAKAKIDSATGQVTITEKMIVQDGKGGHYETVTKTI